MFQKVLIANRGEIAVRIAQTVQEMGMAVVAVFSDADRAGLHVGAADEAFHLHGSSPGDTYLNVPKIIEAARQHGADAIHPGFGFLSENAGFAQACQDAGITFIGPQPDVIAAMGDKIVAKRTLSGAGVPMIPGWSGEANAPAAEIRRAAEEIAYPVLLKAAAGGGGKGMRIVRQPHDLESALGAAQREAKSAFGDARVFVEKYVERPRHVEFQIFGDTHGNVVHLFERECSIQRRYQKIVEESPSPALNPELRSRMAAAAVAAARALHYTSAGTIEFLVDEAGKFYFLEVNTRLQVEHPVTEAVLGQDLVRAQILVAAGEPLPFTQADLQQSGHAMEVRIYAEDPARGFLPSTGRIERYREPRGRCIRVDSGVAEGSEVSVFYDPMLAKLITWGRTRHESLERMLWALRRYVILGPTTNVTFLADLVDHPEFRAGRLHTHFLEEHSIGTADAAVDRRDELFIAAGIGICESNSTVRTTGRLGRNSGPADAADPWTAGHRWRNT